MRLNPRLHEAFSSLGYAYRKTGDFDQALQAYERALVLAPGYAAAIEYQAEAHLGLNRTTEAQQAYDWLFLNDPEKAQALLDAADEWMEQRRQDAAGVSAEAIEAMAHWIAAKKTTATDLGGTTDKPSAW